MARRPDPIRPSAALFVLVCAAGCTALCGRGEKVPGDPTRFDPVASADAVMAFAGEAFTLVGINAPHVRPDGTVDLEDERMRTRIQYNFARPIPTPADAPPLGAGGAEAWHEPLGVVIERAGYAGTESDRHGERQVYTRGMRRLEYGPTAGPAPEGALPPLCPFASLWQVALDRGAPSQAVAEIHYRLYRGEARLTFEIDGFGSIAFDPERCEPLDD